MWVTHCQLCQLSQEYNYGPWVESNPRHRAQPPRAARQCPYPSRCWSHGYAGRPRRVSSLLPFFDLQAGVRFDPEPDTRGHLVVGVQGLAPYMFHVDGALFLSDRGDLTARLEGEYDQRITQRLIVQPRLEVELAAQDIPESGIGAGITKIEAGLRLRYEIQREFAPYVGIEYEAALGETADIARAAGEDPDGLKVLVGLRAWF